ncbi:hypothetical protein RQP46_009030 [Phenoliferia psychrophenolica]
MADWGIKLGEANPDSDIKPAIPDDAVPVPVPVPAQQPSPQPRSPSVDSSIQVYTPELPDHPSGVPYKVTSWDKAEEAKLRKLVEARKDLRPRAQVWDEVAKELGRTSKACNSRWSLLQAAQNSGGASTSGRKRGRPLGKKTPTPATTTTSQTTKKKQKKADDERDARHKNRHRSPPSPSPSPVPVAGPSGLGHGKASSSIASTLLSNELVFIKAASDRLQDQIARMGTATGADAWRLKAEVEETRTTLGNALKAFDPGQ